KTRLRIRGLPEGGVERGRMLRRVGEDRGPFESMAVQGGADSGDLAVHHRTRSHDIRAGARLTQRNFLEQLNGSVVVDPSVPDNERLHETVRVDGRLSDECAESGGPPQPPRPITGTREVSHGLEPPRDFQSDPRRYGPWRPGRFGIRGIERPPR